MKQSNKKRKVILGIFYTLFVVGLLLGTRCESRVHLTTPDKDAKYIAEIASTIHTEAELREVEKIASQYEQAYEHSYNGATLLYFKSLIDPILDEAGDRRAMFRAQEDALLAQQTVFNTRLADLDTAWQMALGTEEEELQKLAEGMAQLDVLYSNLESVTAQKEQLALEIIDAGYPKDMLDKIGELEGNIEQINGEIAAQEHHNSIIVLANRLQLKRDLVIAEPEATIEEGTTAEPSIEDEVLSLE